MHIFSLSFYFVVTIINIFLIILILLDRRRSPARTLSWVLVLMYMPIIGYLLFLFFGLSWRKKRITKRILESYKRAYRGSNESRIAMEELIYSRRETHEKLPVINIANATTRLPLTFNNTVQVFNDTVDAFNAMLNAIAKARHHIHIEYYLIRNDRAGSTLKRALLRKAHEGVQVRLIFDAVGSRESFKHRFFDDLKGHPNIQVTSFRPLLLPMFIINLKANYRNHRKLVEIDGRQAFLGGMNIGDEYLGLHPKFGYWRDTLIKINGDAVKNIQNVFIQDWFFMNRERIPKSKYATPELPLKADGTALHIVPSSPHSNWEPLAQLYFEAIASANQSVYITTPYFIPDEALLMALKTAALGGCDVKLLIPGQADHLLSYLATMSYVEELLLSGIDVYQYPTDRFIHSKVLTVDGILTSIGSANVDQRSMNINFEMNAFIYDRKLTRRMNTHFNQDLRISKRLTIRDVRATRLGMKILESLARLLSPIL